MALRGPRLRLAAKLGMLVALSLAAVTVLGGTAIVGTRQIHEVGLELYAESSAAAKLGAGIALDIQQILGEVRAAPADIDLEHLATTQARVGAGLADLRRRLETVLADMTEQKIREAASRLVLSLATFESAARKVFELSSNFAQAEAVKVLNDSMAPAEAAIKSALSDMSAAADLNAAEKVARMEARAGTVVRTVATVVGALFLGLAALGYAVGTRGISRPLAALNRSMTKLSRGDTTAEIPYAGRHDEIGDMSRAVEIFKRNMIETEELRRDQESSRVRTEAERRSAMRAVADEFESSVKDVAQVVSASSAELQRTAQSMTVVADAASRQSAIVAGASQQASANVQTVASAAEELSTSISEIGQRVAESAKIAGEAVSEAERTNTQVQALSDAAEKIGDVVKLINAIAGQTNLLALNATIEAARAGEAGKGFAVVASEVKNLASQTAHATEEIASQVKAIQSASTGSIVAIRSISQTIGHISQIATTIASAIEEQGAATQEIARNVQQASAGTQEVTSNIAGVTKASSETGAAATRVLGAADDLARQSEALAGQVDAFMAKIRAA